MGSIPAWAGKPRWTLCPTGCSEVYPRVGGETGRSDDSAAACAGLSPRGRGNLSTISSCRSRSGSIPAWAGKPGAAISGGVAVWVYPRVGGETSTRSATATTCAGLSPRGRGNRLSQYSDLDLAGSIPAWAGKPRRGGAHARLEAVYPRVGGETSGGRRRRTPSRGLSPRGRGNPRPIGPFLTGQRSIPAWAGKPSMARPGRYIRGVYPRVGGETMNASVACKARAGLSPRGRGNQRGAPSRAR